ncbi:MAG TPA: hypothetical protein VGH27_31300 [Streptosporangiaceae bacterium]|jgi:hypothetical protein
MSPIALIIGGVLLLAIVGVSLYGAATLPPGAQVPIHFGPGGYNRSLPKKAGLALWPSLAAVVYVIVVTTAGDKGIHGSPATGLMIGLGVILVTQVGALVVAVRGGRR